MNREYSEEARLYRRVAEKIARLIDQGTVRPGERIPSVRRLSQQEGVSVSTVLQAYFLLESRGLVEARPQSGFYVRLPFRKLPPQTADYPTSSFGLSGRRGRISGGGLCSAS